MIIMLVMIMVFKISGWPKYFLTYFPLLYKKAEELVRSQGWCHWFAGKCFTTGPWGKYVVFAELCVCKYYYHGPTTNMRPLNKELGGDVFLIHLSTQVSNSWPLTKMFNPDMASLQLFTLTQILRGPVSEIFHVLRLL